MHRLAYALLAAALCVPVDAQEDPRTALAIKGAAVVIAPGKVLPRATIIVRDGVIAAIGPDLEVPADARVIAGKGRTVYPGFIDGMSHEGYVLPAPTEALDKARSELGWDRTLEVPVGMDPARRAGIWPTREISALLPALAAKADGHRRAGFTAGLVAAKEGFVPGRSALISYTGGHTRHALIQGAVAMHVRFDFKHKVYPGTVMGTMAYLRQLWHDAGWYRKCWEVYDAAGRKGLRRPPVDATLAAMAGTLGGGTRVVFHAQTENEIHRALDLAEQFDLGAAISGGREAYKVSARLAKAKVEVILTLDWPEEPKDPAKKKAEKGKGDDKDKDKTKKDPAAPDKPKADTPSADKPAAPKRPGRGRKGRRGAGGEEPLPPRVFAERHRKWSETVRCATLLHKAGVSFVFATAGTTPKTAMERIEKLIGWGLPADVALWALTTRPARWLGRADSLGRVERGMAAHLLVCTGRLGKGLKVEHAIVDGHHHDATSTSGLTGKPEVDLAGAWAVKAAASGFAATATLTQAKDGALSGEVAAQYGTAKITKGRVGGKQFEFTAVIKFGKQSYELEFSGAAEGGKLDGTVTFGWDGQTHAFSATRPKQQEGQR